MRAGVQDAAVMLGIKGAHCTGYWITYGQLQREFGAKFQRESGSWNQ